MGQWSSDHKQSDKALIRDLQSNDPKTQETAFDLFYARFTPQIKRQIQRRGISEADAETIISDVWDFVVDAIPEFEYQGIPIWHWLSSITRNKIQEFGRMQKTIFNPLVDIETKTEQLTAEPEHNPEMRAAITELQAAIQRELNKLANRLHREIILLHYFHDFSLKEIAKKLDKNYNTIKVNHGRAKERLSQSPILKKLFAETGSRQTECKQ